MKSGDKKADLRAIDGKMIPEEWFDCIKPGDEYILKDIFGAERKAV